MVFSMRASCWCRFATVAAVWLVLGSSGTGRLSAQMPQPSQGASSAAAVDDDAYWAQATTAKVADQWAQSRVTAAPTAPSQPPGVYGYAPSLGGAGPWAGSPQTPGMYPPPVPQSPIGMQGTAGAYVPANPGMAWPAATQPSRAGPTPPGAYNEITPYPPAYPTTTPAAEPAGAHPTAPTYPNTGANVGLPYAAPPGHAQPPAYGGAAMTTPAAVSAEPAHSGYATPAAPSVFGAPPLPTQPAPYVPPLGASDPNAAAPGYQAATSAPYAVPSPSAAPSANAAASPTPPTDRPAVAGSSPGWDNPYGASEHPLLQANNAVDYRSRNVEPAQEAAGPRYGTSAEETSRPVATPSPVAQAAVQTPMSAAPTPAPGPSSREEGAQTGKPQSPEELLRNLLNINGDRCLATVGPEVILLSEILPEVDKLLEPYKGKVPDDALEMQRIVLIQKLLSQHIDIKLLLVDLKNKIPKENLPKLRDQFLEPFEEKEIPHLMKQYEAANRSELDQKMRAEGQSLVQYRQQFIDRTMAGTWARQQIKRDKEITHQDMVDYYRAHLADYEFPAKARWEQLTVDFGTHRTKEEAFRRMAMLGNMVLDGVPFAEVARQHSDGPTAKDGGQRDWTTQGSLVCEALDRALFELPVGQLSPIIEDRNSFHIIRVQERQAAGRVDFLEAQADIRKKLQSQDRSEQVREYIDKLRKEIDVWTIFDEFEEKVAQEAPRTIY